MLHNVAHVNLVEGRQEGVRILGLLQFAGDSLAHFVHFDARFQTLTANLRGCFFRSSLSGTTS